MEKWQNLKAFTFIKRPGGDDDHDHLFIFISAPHLSKPRHEASDLGKPYAAECNTLIMMNIREVSYNIKQ